MYSRLLSRSGKIQKKLSAGNCSTLLCTWTNTIVIFIYRQIFIVLKSIIAWSEAEAHWLYSYSSKSSTVTNESRTESYEKHTSYPSLGRMIYIDLTCVWLRKACSNHGDLLQRSRWTACEWGILTCWFILLSNNRNPTVTSPYMNHRIVDNFATGSIISQPPVSVSVNHGYAGISTTSC